MQIFNIIERLKTVFQVDSDVDLAKILGIKQPTISSWRKRNTIDYELIFTKCNNINFDWLLTGEGKMERSEEKNDAKCALCTEKDRTIAAMTDQIAAKDEIIRLLKGGGKTQRSAPYSGNVSEGRSCQPKE